ncbi:MAG: CoA pyrophosphatase [Pseudomonadota bacterium]|nr:CoA pyrophosphatase [Pseudomonadota bacterium]
MSRLLRLNLPPALPDPEPLRTRSAVAVVVGPEDDLLFIRRAERIGDPWSGDMAFPGGREEPADGHPRATAERETFEEVGLDLSGATFLGALSPMVSPLRIPSKGFGIHPFVFRVDTWPAFTMSEEVASVHRLALARILAGEGREEFTYRGHGIERVLPCMRLDGTFIWGLTLRVVDDLVERLRALP